MLDSYKEIRHRWSWHPRSVLTRISSAADATQAGRFLLESAYPVIILNGCVLLCMMLTAVALMQYQQQLTSCSVTYPLDSVLPVRPYDSCAASQRQQLLQRKYEIIIFEMYYSRCTNYPVWFIKLNYY